MSAYDRAFDRALDEWLKAKRSALLEDAIHGMEPEPYWRIVGYVQALDELTADLTDIRKKLGAES